MTVATGAAGSPGERPPALAVDGDQLAWRGERVALEGVQGFDERWNAWTGRGWLEVRGTSWRIPLDGAYAAHRRLLRAHLADRPFESDWGDGRFPAAPFGLPVDLVTAAVAIVVGVVAGACAWTLGGPLGSGAGIALVGAAVVPLARLRDAVVVQRGGVRVGPAWAPRTPWHEVEEVRWQRAGGACRVWVRGSRSGGVATVPAVLLPALRARLRRQGGLELVEAAPDLDDRYVAWLAPASGMPWGVLAATVAGVLLAPQPWLWLGGGLLCAAAIGLLGAAVEARATGWGAGGVLYAAGAYGVVLVALALGLGGWLAG